MSSLDTVPLKKVTPRDGARLVFDAGPGNSSFGRVLRPPRETAVIQLPRMHSPRTSAKEIALRSAVVVLGLRVGCPQSPCANWNATVSRGDGLSRSATAGGYALTAARGGRSIVHMRAVANWLVVARIALTRLGGSFIGHVRAVANWPMVARIGDPARHNRLECLTMQASVAAGSHRADVASTASIDRSDVREALAEIRMPVAVVGSARGPRAVVLDAGGLTPEIARQDVFAVLPPIYPEWLGERGFTAAHGVRFPYVIGEMARGIATARMTVEGVRAGVMGFFGSAGLDLGAVEAGVREIQDALGREAGGWGANLIHNIQDDGLEIATVDLFHRLGVRCVSASAFMRLTPAIVLYAQRACAAVRTDRSSGPDGSSPRCPATRSQRQFLLPCSGSDVARAGRRGPDHRRGSQARGRNTDSGGHHRRSRLRRPHR